MSEQADYLREQIARIEELREEALKRCEEQHKLAAESLKLSTEMRKLSMMKAATPDSDRLWRLFVGIVVAGSVGNIIAGAQVILNLF